jgi:assimilatory nitrate reductase catalytic subunit
VAPLWRGLLLRRNGLPPADNYYWARVPLDGGQAFEFAGWEPLPSGRGTETWVGQLMGAAPSAEMVIFADPARGAFRYATIVEDRLEACLFFARRRSELPARETAAATLHGEISAAARLGLLCGRAANEAVPGDRTICTCFGVSLRTLSAAIAGRRLSTVAEIGSALRAGTNCGSCVPELKAVLRAS